MAAWPWTVNANGEGRYFTTRDDAVGFVRELQRQGVQSIDVGCMQVNLRWHPSAFRSLEEAFDPAANVAYAAVFLEALRNAYGAEGDAGWIDAVGLYHSRDESRAAGYRRHVSAHWDETRDGVVVGAAAIRADAGGGTAPARSKLLVIHVPTVLGAERERARVAWWQTPEARGEAAAGAAPDGGPVRWVEVRVHPGRGATRVYRVPVPDLSKG
jgi:hypothetical protein